MPAPSRATTGRTASGASPWKRTAAATSTTTGTTTPTEPRCSDSRCSGSTREHRLTRRLYAAAARYVPGDGKGRWELVDAWIREFDGLTITSSQRFAGPQPVDLPEEPEFFNTEVKYAEQMNRIELRRHIDELVAAGTDVPDLEMQLHNKTAMPVVSLVMALVALPFAFRLGRQGALYGIGISIVVGIVYYTVISVFTTLGQSETLPPLIAAWSPNALVRDAGALPLPGRADLRRCPVRRPRDEAWGPGRPAPRGTRIGRNGHRPQSEGSAADADAACR